jgi:hypothetical protein
MHKNVMLMDEYAHKEDMDMMLMKRDMLSGDEQ